MYRLGKVAFVTYTRNNPRDKVEVEGHVPLGPVMFHWVTVAVRILDLKWKLLRVPSEYIWGHSF
jgi:hypothetical protein